MATTFSTHTANFRALIASSRFTIPEFQRRYSWRVEHELADLWRDLDSNPKDEAYFMGIIIVTEGNNDRLSVVDGQQRMISLSLLANVIRILARQENKALIERSVRDGILFTTDFANDTEVPRLELSHDIDKEAYNALIHDQELVSTHRSGTIYAAHEYLFEKMQSTLQSEGTAVLSSWASFLTEKLYMSAFINQTADSAYKVFEVVNARGKSLTPSEMIKAYVIGSMLSERNRKTIYNRWITIEKRFEDANAQGQLTQFVRHTLTLRHGYVLPRDLYRIVTEKYQGEQVVDLIDFLEENLDLYLGLVEPGSAIEGVSSNFIRLSTILELLGLTTVRPIIMAASKLDNASTVLEELVSIILPRIVVGTFGTGATESRFAKAAESLYRTHEWQRVSEDINILKPQRSDFEEKVATRKLNRSVLCLLRLSVLQRTKLPEIDSFLHYIRQAKVSNWPGFNDEDFDSIGRTIGNSVLLETESRPYGATNPQSASTLFAPVLREGESITENLISQWTADIAASNGRLIAREAAGVWYD